MWSQFFWFAVTFAAFFVPFILFLVDDRSLASYDGQFVLTYYGAVILSRLFLQIVFALGNRAWIGRVSARPAARDSDYTVLVVGRQEDESYFRMCVASTQRLYPAPKRTIFVIDGDEAKDLYMQAIVKDHYPEAVCLENDLRNPAIDLEKVRDSTATVLCISQTHVSKRRAQYTGYMLANTDFVLTTDSDTIVDRYAPDELLKVMYASPDAGCVTGDVRIFNVNNALALLTSLKYWFAFNLERAAQSFWNVNLCASGPGTLYRMSKVGPLLQDWLQQRFGCEACCCLNQECTYGDDRHMTTLLLKEGWTTLYTHRALFWTETPTNVCRWLTQQVRWTKSAHRETWLVMEAFWKRPWNLWFIFDTMFLFYYGFFLIVLSLALIFEGRALSVLLLFQYVFAIAVVRGLYAALVERSFRYLLFGLYGYLYYLCLLPMKVWAICTMCDNSWGTSMRRRRHFNVCILIPVLAWNFALFSGTIWSVVEDGDLNFEWYYAAWSAGVALSILLLECTRRAALRSVNANVLDRVLPLVKVGDDSLEAKREEKRLRQTDSMMISSELM